MQGSDGALYGTTTVGGTNNVGTVFELNTDGSGYQVLHSFLTNGVDGQQPYGALVRGLDNKLYGTTYSGGTNGGGTIFEVGLGGADYTVLYDFGNAAVTNSNPFAGLAQGPASDGSGVLYGTTTLGVNGGVFGIVVNPPLTITPAVSQSGANPPVVFWPAWALNYVLQTTTNLTSGVWVPATNGLPVTGLQLTNATAPNAYFRLSLQ